MWIGVEMVGNVVLLELVFKEDVCVNMVIWGNIVKVGNGLCMFYIKWNVLFVIYWNLIRIYI